MDRIRDWITVGKQHFDARQYHLAEEYFRKVIDAEPRYADVFNLLGVIAHAEGRFSSAMEYFEKALSLNPRYTEATLNLAVLLNDLGQYDRARTLYTKLKAAKGKRAPEIEPVLRGKLSNLHADIGDIYRSISLHAHSVDEYRKALDLNPDYLDIRTKLAQALRELGKNKDTLRELAAVLKANPRYVPALIQLGITNYVLKKVLQARTAWKKVLSIDPKNPLASMYLRLCDAIASTSPATSRATTRGQRAKKQPAPRPIRRR
jgi:tetratricopeptide (TPR) repeat protein